MIQLYDECILVKLYLCLEGRTLGPADRTLDHTAYTETTRGTSAYTGHNPSITCEITELKYTGLENNNQYMTITYYTLRLTESYATMLKIICIHIGVTY